MAIDEDATETAEGRDDGKTIVKFTAPPATWAYLGWLSRNTVLGKTESDVARQLLIQMLAQMRQEEYKWDLRS
jgi:hypothetical protein